uniref:Uncharacterized protein n=1 Tax=Anguilla anguilla TaxID=7936 RepID=A0A0E9X4F6_ANGAN
MNMSPGIYQTVPLSNQFSLKSPGLLERCCYFIAVSYAVYLELVF